MLKRVYIDNYRCFVNFTCDFTEKQLILGSNGVGKTSLFDVIALLRDFCVTGIQDDRMFVGYTRTRWQEVTAQTFELEVSGNDGSYTFRLIIESWGNPVRPRVVTEEVLYSGSPIFRFTNGEVQLYNDRHELKVKYPFDWHRSALATITDRPENTKLSWFKRWFGRLWFITPDPRQMLPLAESEATGPARNLSNFASWYRHLRLENDDQELLADLREVIPGLQSMDLKEAGMGNRILALTFKGGEKNGKQQTFYTFNELSDGQRVLIGLYTILHFGAKNGISLFLDEPDNFIALAEIQPWMNKLIDQIEESNAQVLFISHHPEFFNQLAFENGILLDRPNELHTRVRSFKDLADTGLTPAELVARGWENE